MPASVLLACVGGLVSALFHLSVLAGGLGSVILLYMATLPLLLTGLSLGSQAVFIASGVGSVVTAVIGGEWLGFSYLILNAVPVVLLVRQSLLARTTGTGDGGNVIIEWYPPGLLLSWLTGLGVVAILIAVLVTANDKGGLEGVIISVLVTALHGAVTMTKGQATDAAAAVAPLVPGFVVVSWLLMVIGNAALAQGALVRFKRNLRPSMQIRDVVVPHWLTMVLVLCILIGVLAGGTPRFIATNLAIVVAMPFFFAGLGVIHAMVERRASRLLVLSIFYIVLMLLGWPALIVVGLGIIEQWAGLRRRFVRTGPDQEEV